MKRIIRIKKRKPAPKKSRRMVLIRKKKNPYLRTDKEIENNKSLTKVIYTNEKDLKEFEKYIDRLDPKKPKYKQYKDDKINILINDAVQDIIDDIKKGRMTAEQYFEDPRTYIQKYNIKKPLLIPVIMQRVADKFEHDNFEEVSNFFDQVKYKNPTRIDKAKKLFIAFNRYKPTQTKNININLSKKLVKLGHIDNFEYLSDKMIFASDQKTRKRKTRTYVHSFKEFDKKPMLFTNETGDCLIIYDPVHKIKVKKEGLI